jgi:hypothetical protein
MRPSGDLEIDELSFGTSTTYKFPSSSMEIDELRVAVTENVTEVNNPPVAVDDAQFGTAEDTALTVTALLGVLANDDDVDEDLLTATLVGQPQNGAVNLGTDGGFTYTPNLNFNGTDTFTYTATDGTATSGTATVSITVTAVNDPPTGTVTIAGTATEGQVLTAAHTLADEDGIGTITYHWSRSGALIDGATGNTYTLTQDDVGAVITVTASYIDGEGTPESVTSAATATVAIDTDGDGIGNDVDTDDDGDGVADGSDAFPLDAAESVDTDGDGVGNNADTDDDGDGFSDILEARFNGDPLDPSDRDSIEASIIDDMDTAEGTIQELQSQNASLESQISVLEATVVSNATEIAELSQRPTLEQVRDGRPGSVLLSVDSEAGSVVLDFTVEESEDLITWTPVEGPGVSQTLTLPEGKRFYRFAH